MALGLNAEIGEVNVEWDCWYPEGVASPEGMYGEEGDVIVLNAVDVTLTSPPWRNRACVAQSAT